MVETSTPVAESASYDPAYFARLFAIEDRHFWFRARIQVITTLVSQITARMAPGYRVLEVGSGTGVVLKALEKICDRGFVVGMDLFIEGLRYARRRTRCALVQADMHTPPFTATFDVIGLFDVLEHLPDDVQVLRDLHTMLVPGGTLLLTVPAHMSLWSYFDEASHHCRRYEEADLASKLRATGYTVEYLTPIMMALFPLIWSSRRVARFLRRKEMRAADVDAMAMRELRILPVANGVLAWILTQEARLVGKRKKLWTGTSLLVIARKTVAHDED